MTRFILLSVCMIMSLGSCRETANSDMLFADNDTQSCGELTWGDIVAEESNFEAIRCRADPNEPDRYFLSALNDVCVIRDGGRGEASSTQEARCNAALAEENGPSGEISALYKFDANDDVRIASETAAIIYYHFYKNDAAARYIAVEAEHYCIQDINRTSIDNTNAEVLSLGVASQMVDSAIGRCSELARRHGIVMGYR